MFNKITSLFLLVFSMSLFLVSCDDSDPVAPSEEHFEAAGFMIKNETGDIIFKTLKGQIDNSVSTVFSIALSDGLGQYEIEFLDEEGNNIGEPDETGTSLLIDIEGIELATILIDMWGFSLTPTQIGTTNFRIQILHEGHPDFTSPYYPLEIN